MPVMPGGKIIGGIGGRIYVGALGTEPQTSGNSFFDVANWQIQSIYHNAECTHSGTWGAVTRRMVAYDWRFTAGVPLDQDNIPEWLLNYPQSVALTFFLGDVKLNEDAIVMGMQQKYYFAPSALLDAAVPVLDGAGRDVIRMQVAGSGNSVIWILPDENEGFQQYKSYLKSRGWAY